MLGAIVGDIVGSRFEFNNNRNKNFALFGDGCYATDDSIMTIAVANALLLTRENKSDLSEETVHQMQEIGRPYPKCGYGGKFFKWMYSDEPKPYNSFGNGAAMRVSPVAYVANDLDEVKNLSRSVTSVTHNHPEGIKGAEAVSVATWMALNYATKSQIIRMMEKYYDIDFTIDQIRTTYKFNETCQQTVPQAIVAFKDGDDFEDVLRTAISVGGDSDTLAAIACSIAGAYYGVPMYIEREAKKYLDRRMLNVLNQFELMYCNSR